MMLLLMIFLLANLVVGWFVVIYVFYRWATKWIELVPYDYTNITQNVTKKSIDFYLDFLIIFATVGVFKTSVINMYIYIEGLL